MATGRIICSIVVVVIAGVGLAAVWQPAFFAGAYEFLSAHRDESLTAFLFIVTSAALGYAWCGKRRDTRLAGCCTDETDECRKRKYAALPNPYPESYGEGASITAFEYESHLHLLRLKKRLPYIDSEEQYIVAKDYSVGYQLNGANTWEQITVPRGTLTDLSSSPGPARLFLGRVGPHLEASIVHDYLYIAWQVKDLNATDDMRHFADDLMLAAMREAGMGCKADIIHLAICLFGKRVFYGRNREPLILCGKQLPRCCGNGEEERTESPDCPSQGEK